MQPDDGFKIGVVSQELEASGMNGLVEEKDADEYQIAYDSDLEGEKVKEVNNDQTQLGDILGHEYKKEFLSINKDENSFWSILEEESKLSLNQQKDLEKKTMTSKLSFDNYKKKYYRS